MVVLWFYRGRSGVTAISKWMFIFWRGQSSKLAFAREKYSLTIYTPMSNPMAYSRYVTWIIEKTHGIPRIRYWVVPQLSDKRLRAPSVINAMAKTRYSTPILNRGTRHLSLLSLSLLPHFEFFISPVVCHIWLWSYQVTQQELNDGNISYTVSVAGLAVNEDVVGESYTWADGLLQEDTISIGRDRCCRQSGAIALRRRRIYQPSADYIIVLYVEKL